MKKVLIIEDDLSIAELLKDYLTKDNFEVSLIDDGNNALKVFNQIEPDVLILDIMLPNKNGIEICKEIRTTSNIPILIISAKTSETDKVVGLELGADDYVSKPFSPREVVARVKALLRRSRQNHKDKQRKKIRDIEIDFEAYEVKKNGININLSPKEFEVFAYFVKNPNKVLTKENIYNQIWQNNYYGDLNTVTVHVKRIREKLLDDPLKPKYIDTIWGVGYKFIGQDHE